MVFKIYLLEYFLNIPLFGLVLGNISILKTFLYKD